ncbi:hypothetical protein ERX37_07900 [Macrococcus hajekii]|uniref:Uncharacterized protein n=1 Tax=Macrococcus hajekii TaxID=198482 RepID=A0A4R6BIN8_9STAP|nr:hypothetical protein [Macrococcus hajekii]TDM01416.1 hypothetical protein ERX37_07900 [Macrococcus hajekii]GGA99783.1 hypothetical protein GCM10007190_04800 [Macrococcus hajekii]
MTQDKRTGWLAELKVGDRVIIHESQYGAITNRIGRIQKITPAGKIDVLNRRFDEEGRQRNGYGYWGGLIQYSEEKVAEINAEEKRKKLMRILRDFDWTTTPLKDLEEIAKKVGVL